MEKRRPTTQDVTWFLDLDRQGRLDLEPPYQRWSVWTLKDRKYFLETVFHNYPCPAIFLHKTVDQSGVPTYHVVDGKQRLETIIRFANNEIALGKSVGDTNLNGKKFSRLDASQKQVFWDYIFAVEFVGTVEKTFIEEMFIRINRNSRKLQEQEIRHARFDGWFITFAEGEAEKDEWKSLNVVTTARAKRMQDVQFLSELFSVVLDGKIVGFNHEYLDKKYAEYDDPQETQVDFSEEEFRKRIEKIKKYLLKMEEHNECLTRHAKSVSNFYSLWAVVALDLNRLPKPPEAAAKYDNFMNKVVQLSKLTTEEISGKAKNRSYQEPYNYFINVRGATTEFPQREQRDKSLKSVLLNN